ncbi:hypothetical protein MASR2M15_23140 [Anaerolineales bacterium]
MPNPTITFAFICATLIGSIFHFIFGGDAKRLALILLGSWLGFAAGHFAAYSLGIEFYRIGDLNFGIAMIGAIFVLFVILFLSRQRVL